MRELLDFYLNSGMFGFLEYPINEVHIKVALHHQGEEEVEKAVIAMEYVCYQNGIPMGC